MILSWSGDVVDERLAESVKKCTERAGHISSIKEKRNNILPRESVYYFYNLVDCPQLFKYRKWHNIVTSAIFNPLCIVCVAVSVFFAINHYLSPLIYKIQF